MMHTSFPSIFISHANLKHSLYRLTTYKHSAILTCIICYCVLAPVCISIFLRQLVFNLCQLTLQFFFLFFIYISTTNLLLYLLFFLFQLLYLSINRICICCTFFRLIISICRFYPIRSSTLLFMWIIINNLRLPFSSCANPYKPLGLFAAFSLLIYSSCGILLTGVSFSLFSVLFTTGYCLG